MARVIGVSQATVSNAFHRPNQLSRELRERILAVARHMGYPGPDPLANTFRRGVTGAVGFIVHEPLQYLFEDAAARLTMTGVAEACSGYGSSLVLVTRAEQGRPDLVSTALVDGFVAFCDPLGPDRLESLAARRLPVVGLDAPIAPGKPFVGIDDCAAARSAAQHLASLGHRRIGVITFPLFAQGRAGVVADGLAAHGDYVAGRDRLRGYRQGLAPVLAAGGEAIVVAAAGVTESDGAVAASVLLGAGTRPTAILAMSDRLAVGALDFARARGIAVPGQLSVVGFDDVPQAARSSPPLTTVAQPHAEKGALAVRLLLDREAPVAVGLLPTRLVVRASTAAAPPVA